jgi:hypothetical protein
MNIIRWLTRHYQFAAVNMPHIDTSNAPFRF